MVTMDDLSKAIILLVRVGAVARFIYCMVRLAAAEAYGHKSGARDLRNVLRRRVEDPICTLLAGCPEQPPALIHAEEKDGEIVLVTA